jgi:hypothetical protein
MRHKIEVTNDWEECMKKGKGPKLSEMPPCINSCGDFYRFWKLKRVGVIIKKHSTVFVDFEKEKLAIYDGDVLRKLGKLYPDMVVRKKDMKIIKANLKKYWMKKEEA